MNLTEVCDVTTINRVRADAVTINGRAAAKVNAAAAATIAAAVTTASSVTLTAAATAKATTSIVGSQVRPLEGYKDEMVSTVVGAVRDEAAIFGFGATADMAIG